MKIIKQDLETIIYNRGKNWYIIWNKNGKRHREDGPASIWDVGHEYYRLDGYSIGKDSYWKEVHANY